MCMQEILKKKSEVKDGWLKLNLTAGSGKIDLKALANSTAKLIVDQPQYLSTDSFI